MLKKLMVVSIIIGCAFIWAQGIAHPDLVIEKSAFSTDVLQLNNKSPISELPLITMEKMKDAMKRSHQYAIIEHFGNETAGEPTKIDIIPQVKRLIKDNSKKLEEPILYDGRSQGNVSTTPSGASTWLGGAGTGGCTSGGSYWYRYIIKPYESIVWVLKAEYETADYDLILWDYPSHGTILAGAWATTYPDTLYYTNNSSSYLWVFLEVDFYSGNQNDIFYCSNVRRPITSSDPHYLTDWALNGEPVWDNPTDGIEGYHQYPSTENSHWYSWVVPSWWTVDFCLQITYVGGGYDYDLEIYDSGLNLITGAYGISYPDKTGWISSSYAGEPLYIRIYCYETIRAEYRIDFGGEMGIEENNTAPTACKLFSCSPNPARNEFSIKYSIAQTGNVALSLYDVQGRQVMNIVDKEHSRGIYTRSVDLTKTDFPKGIYFLRLEANGVKETEKIVIVK